METHVHGARGTDNIFLGVAMKSGLQKVVVPFLDKGIPVEYEVVRSLCTVAQPKRRGWASSAPTPRCTAR